MSIFEDRAVEVLHEEGGIPAEQAQWLVEILAKAHVLRTESGLDRWGH
jgi:hypothetical protein